jgi:hypothetical protein
MRLQQDPSHAGLLAGACNLKPVARAGEEAGAVDVPVDRPSSQA